MTRIVALRVMAFAGMCWVLVACGGAIQLEPTTPGASAQVAQTQGISAVQVAIAPTMPEDRAAQLQKLQVPSQLQQAIQGSFASAGQQRPDGAVVEVQIHQYRLGHWGPARLGAEVTVTDGAGAVVKSFSSHSASTRGGSDTTRTQRLAQDLVQRITDAT